MPNLSALYGCSAGARPICRDDAPPGRIRYGDAPCCRARLSRGCDCANWSAGARPICRATLRRGGASSMAILRVAGATVPWMRLCRLVCRGAVDLPGDAPPGRGIRYGDTPCCRGDCPVGATVPIGLPGRGRSAGTTGRMCVTVRDAAARFVFGEKVVPLSRSGSGQEQFRAQPPTSST